MKKRYTVFREAGFNNDGNPSVDTIKTFKNQPEAMAFYNDPRNTRRYGTLFMSMQDADGNTYNWDDRKGAWQ